MSKIFDRLVEDKEFYYKVQRVKLIMCIVGGLLACLLIYINELK